MATLDKNIHPAKYYRDYLSNNIRPDGRKFMSFRPAIINVGTVSTAEGSAVIRIGKTAVVCGIKAELATPTATEPDRGFIVANVDLPPLCSSKFRPGPPSDEAQVYTGFVDDLINKSNMINTQQLCIAHDKLAWVLYCDFICLDHDGAILDACVIALSAALRTVTLPEVIYNTENGEITVNEDNRSHLAINSVPVATTFCSFDGMYIMADPNAEEEYYGTGTFTVVTQNNKLTCLHKPGGSPLTADELKECISKAKERTKHLIQLIDTAIMSPER